MLTRVIPVAQGVFSLIAVVAPAFADQAAYCPEHFLDGVEPVVVSTPVSTQTTELCYRQFAVLHSGLTRTPLYAAEHLTAGSVARARALPRHGSFHSEPTLPQEARAELRDYERSGYDRGHMAPDGDMADADAEHESYSLANVVPQDPHLNRGAWARVEDLVRNLASWDGEVYAVTGPVFGGDKIALLHGRVAIPTAVFKAIYDPKLNVAGAYVADNVAPSSLRVVSLAELRQMTDLSVFPTIGEPQLGSPGRLPDLGDDKGGDQ